MKLFRGIFLPVLIICSCYLASNAQDADTVLNHIITKTTKLYANHPNEKVYLHFDKPYYAVGDTIWFKAYLTIDLHQPSALSKIIYVDVLNSRDSVMNSLQLQVKNGVAWSDIPLSQYNYSKGNYHIIAYTNWMNNNDPAYFFSKTITIGDAINNKLSTQINLTGSFTGKQQKVTAQVAFKNDQGVPLADKKVNWSVEKDGETIIKGKGILTDKTGLAKIDIINTKSADLGQAYLVTSIDNGSKKEVTSRFPLSSAAAPNDVQFFPEGGALLSGIPTKVAFKALQPNGLGIGLKGVIIDNSNKTVLTFTSSHIGMGNFMFTPQDNKTYTAKVTYADGSTGMPDLPKIETGGISLSLDNTGEDVLKIKLQSDSAFLREYKNKTFFILAKSGGVICFGAKTQLQNQVYTANVPKSKFPTGIVQVTLFIADGEPVSERIAFIQHNDQLKLSLNTEQPVYATRQRVKININAKKTDQPDVGNFSLTVLDDAKVPFDENAETTILSYLLLTSDIKGYIEKPNYYFNHADEKTAADLDNLLLTQGYRRFSYDGIMTDKMPAITYLPEQGIDISGTLRGNNGIPVKGGNIKISIPDKNYFQNTTTDADGHFRFSDLIFLDSAKVTVSAKNNSRAEDMVLTLDNPPNQKLPVNVNAPDAVLNIDSLLSAYLKNSKLAYSYTNVLKEVVIRDVRTEPTVSHKDYGNLSSLSTIPDHLIKGSSIKDCGGTALDCLKVLAIGMTFDQDNFYVTRDYNSGKRVPAQVFIRGGPVDVSALYSLDVNTIESVEVFVKDELGLVNSAYNSDGAIVVNLKKIETQKISLQDLKALMPRQYEVNYSPKGYAALRTFYLPRYSGPRASQTNKIDTRTTIYWNPNIETDKDGNASFEFFNADGTGTYRAIIEGIDKDGNIGRQLYRYTVK